MLGTAREKDFLRPENLRKKNLGVYNRKLNCYAKTVVAVM